MLPKSSTFRKVGESLDVHNYAVDHNVLLLDRFSHVGKCQHTRYCTGILFML